MKRICSSSLIALLLMVGWTALPAPANGAQESEQKSEKSGAEELKGTVAERAANVYAQSIKQADTEYTKAVETLQQTYVRRSQYAYRVYLNSLRSAEQIELRKGNAEAAARIKKVADALEKEKPLGAPEVAGRDAKLSPTVDEPRRLTTVNVQFTSEAKLREHLRLPDKGWSMRDGGLKLLRGQIQSVAEFKGDFDLYISGLTRHHTGLSIWREHFSFRERRDPPFKILIRRRGTKLTFSREGEDDVQIVLKAAVKDQPSGFSIYMHDGVIKSMKFAGYAEPKKDDAKAEPKKNKKKDEPRNDEAKDEANNDDGNNDDRRKKNRRRDRD